MVCYAVPATVALLSVVLRQKYNVHSKYAQWFTLLFAGGATFGVVDHLWNGELFLIGPNIASDLLLGFAITATLFTVWLAVVSLDKAKMPSKVEV